MNDYEANGIAAILWGFERMIRLMNEELDRMIEAVDGPTKDHHGWPADPEARKQEAQRRFAARNANSPKRPKSSTAAKDVWNNMSVRQRQNRLKAMQRGRVRAAAARVA